MKFSRTSECELKVGRVTIDPDNRIDAAWLLVDEAEDVVDGDRLLIDGATLPAEVTAAIDAIRAYVETNSGVAVTTKQSDRAAKIAAKKDANG